MNTESLITKARAEFHAGLLQSTLTVDSSGIASNADRGNRMSVQYAAHIATALKQDTIHERAAGQTLGGSFERAVAAFLTATFPRLDCLRPGDWDIANLGGTRRGNLLAAFEPYRHLDELGRAVTANPELLAVLGNAYAIAPDVIVTRGSVSDETINERAPLVDEQSALLTPLRERNNPHARILHAVVSCKWTLRSDRAQNARSEALNLVRNRKGRTPHIVVVTGEPTPSRISSLALGTGDIDTVYHFALPELQEAVREHGTDDTVELLDMMVEGQRLRDIADLPLDLAI